MYNVRYMKILFFGDIVGKPGREGLKKILPDWKDKYRPDLVIANGENIAHGFGIGKKSLNEVLDAGVDFITSGDHTFNQEETKLLLEDKSIPLIKPANMPGPGRGYAVIEVGTKKVLIINLIGQIFMKEEYDNPFECIDKILAENDIKIIIVDWHAEATSEKVCMGWHLDGRVSAVLGTHTHIPTADARVLTKGTAYITDIGMVGVRDSSLGMDKELALKRFLTKRKIKLEIAEGLVSVNAVLIEIKKDGQAKSIELLQKTIAL